MFAGCTGYVQHSHNVPTTFYMVSE